MNNYLRGVCAGLMLGGTLLSAGCEGVVYTGGAGVYYDYDYYPDCDVYYYPRTRIYYWSEGGRWYSGERLPPHFEFHAEHREQLRLHSQQPWTEHHEEHRNYEHHDDHDRGHDHDHN